MIVGDQVLLLTYRELSLYRLDRMLGFRSEGLR
jgi:hypothetical protein